MEENLFGAIQQRYGSMSKSFKRTADFIVMMRERTLLYPVSQLARHVGVSDATIVRFCQFMGYAGYDELKHALISATAKESSGGLGNFSSQIHSLGSEHEYIQIAFEYELSCLNTVIRDFSYDRVGAAIDALEQARRIFFLGLGSSAIPAQSLFFYFDRLQLNCVMLDYGGKGLMEKLAFASAEDMLFAVSFPHYSVDTYNAMKRARENGVVTALISDGGSEMLRELTDIEFRVPSKNPFLMYNSNVGALSLCNILVLEYCYRHEDECSRIIREVNKTVEQFNVK